MLKKKLRLDKEIVVEDANAVKLDGGTLFPACITFFYCTVTCPTALFCTVDTCEMACGGSNPCHQE